MGVAAIIYTDIARDGMMQGPNIEATRALAEAITIPVIASGGVSSLRDIENLMAIEEVRGDRGDHRQGDLHRRPRSARGGGADQRQIHSRLTQKAQSGKARRMFFLRPGLILCTLALKGNFTMLTKRIIPCLDVKDGRVVKGVQFLELRDAGDPVEAAEAYDAQGADELTFLDITASSDKRSIILDVVARTAERVFMPLTVGGGVREIADIRNLLNAGADKVSINTAAVHRPEFVREAAERFGSQCIVVAIDARRVPGDPQRWEVFTHGGRNPTGIDAVEWAARMDSFGAGEILLTSMDKDGTKDGYDIELTRASATGLRFR